MFYWSSQGSDKAPVLVTIFLEYHTAEFSLKLSFPENVKIIVDLNKNRLYASGENSYSHVPVSLSSNNHHNYLCEHVFHKTGLLS